MDDAPLLAIEQAERVFGGGRTLFGQPKPAVHAVQDVTLNVRKGETLGVVGESGCGKSTLARMVVGLDAPTGGRIVFDGRDIVAEAGRDLRRLSREVQYVFQDPVASLNPRKTIRTILEAPLIHLLNLDKAEREKRLGELMDAVNLAPEFLDRYPHEFSGGQAQRIGVARALAADPKLIVLDEPVSALDVSVQAQVLNILDDLKDRFGLTYVFISHDLSVVESVSDRVAVMYFGRVVEVGPGRSVFRSPRHPYTHLLLNRRRRPAAAR
jgi:ABC-type oligopeptide transport system ATPase subunit